jgi:hypothetical protein
MGLFSEWDVPFILEQYRLIDASEADDIYARMSKDNAETVLSGYVKRAYFDYRKATKFCTETPITPNQNKATRNDRDRLDSWSSNWLSYISD